MILNEELIEHINNDAVSLSDIVFSLQKIQDSMSIMNNAERETIKLEFFQSIVNLINKHGNVCKENGMNKTSIWIIRISLLILTNSFVNCTRNQNIIVDELLVHLINNIIWILQTQDCIHGSTCEEVKEEWKLAKIACSKCLSNLVAGNSHSRKHVWPYLKEKLGVILNVESGNASRILCCAIHNCLLEDDVRLNVTQEKQQLEQLIKILIQLDEETKSANDFVQLTLNDLLPLEGVIQQSWTNFTPSEKNHIISYVTSIIEIHDRGNKEWARLPSLSVIECLIQIFKEDADMILRTFTDRSSVNLSADVMSNLLSFAALVSASDSYKKDLQKDRSLLISTVYLLRAMSGCDYFNRITTNSLEMQEECEHHPAYGFKANLIRLIGLLCHKNKDNQDLVRDINGIFLILENSQVDAINPLIKENALFTIHCLLEDNEENKVLLRGLKIQGVAENKALDDLGLEATVEDGKIKLTQKDK